MVDNFWIAAGKALGTELDEFFTTAYVLHDFSSFTRRKDICEHFQTHLVVVLHALSFRIS